jgi:cellulose synthase/poly-beta-1,6-N-acetylglucosamine synthase-like glycosyltransferase
MDRAATQYPGECRVVIVDNNSTDQTLAVAERALRQCDYLTGQVLECRTPGKSKALNLGLEHLEAEIMVRVDADTVIEEDCLSKIAMHFADPEVGGVGGLPLPLNQSGWFSWIRRVEVYHNVAWTRVGQMATDSVLVVPGMLSSFRTHLVKQLGGFVEGINGEDMDMTVRVGRSGYRIVVDPDIVFRTEVPADIEHMREQRLRWSRGVFHVFTRNVSSFWLRQGVRGMWVMPLSAFGFWRRALVPLLIVYAAVTAAFNPELLNLRNGATFAAIVFGPEVLVTLLAVLAFRQFRLVPFIPAYFVFRLFRAYIGLEVLLSLHQKAARRTETATVRQPAGVTQASV